MKILIPLILLFMTACTLTPKDTGKSYMFSLNSIQSTPSKSIRGTLVVDLPVASLELDTFRVALQRNGNVKDYYAGVRWSEFLPSVVQGSFVGSIESSAIFDNVTSDDISLNGDYLLKTEIRKFYATYKNSQEPPEIEVHLAITVRNLNKQKNISSFTVTGRDQAANNQLPSIQISFEKAFNQAQQQMLKRLKRL